MMELTSLLSCIPFYETTSDIENIEIDTLEMDSRAVNEGSLFVCIPGFTVDGHHFVDEAVSNGAAAIIAEKPVKADVPVINVSDTARTLSVLAVKFYQDPTKN